MSVWNNSGTHANWQGNGAITQSKNVKVSTLSADEIYANNISTGYLHAGSISSFDGSIAFLSNLVLNTGVIGLGVGPSFLTANDGILYVNGQAVAFPSTISTVSGWSFFPALSHVNMARSSIYNVQSISTNFLSTGVHNAGVIRASGVSSQTLSTNRLTFDTLNGRAGVIGILSGDGLVYNDIVNSNLTTSNVFSRNIFASSIVSSNSIRSLGLSSITVSTFLIEANTVAASAGVAAQVIEVRDTLYTKNMILFDPIYPSWNSNTLYLPSNIVQDTFNYYRALTSNLNVTPGSNLASWTNANAYFVNNFTFLDGVAAYRCISNVAAGAPNPPNLDEAHWVRVSYSNDGSQVWDNFEYTTGGITGSIKSYISVGSIVVSNAYISTLTSGALSASGNISTTGNITAAGNIRASGFVSSTSVNTNIGLISTLNVNNVSTGNFTTGLCTTFSTQTQHISLYNGPYTQYDSARVYVPGNGIIYSNRNYIAFSSNRGMLPNVNIPNWINGATYQPFNYAFVIGAGCYRCLNTVTSPVPPNSDSVNWAVFSPFNLIAQLWTPLGPTVGASIVGDANSFINVGSLNVSSITVNNISTGTSINLSNITSYSITNSNSLSNGGNFSNTGNFSNAGDANINTLTTHGQVYTQDILNVQGLMSLQSDLYGQVSNITLLVPPFTTSKQYLKDINDIRTGNFQTVNIVGGSTGRTVLPDYFEYSELNIGATETSPAIVNIYGVNAELTTALTVYGLTSFNGDTTINGLASINGLTDINGDLTVLGFANVGGTLDVGGIATITGATNIGGVLTVEGETNIAGALTAEAGIGIVGATTIQLGDISIGNSSGGPTNNYNLYVYYNNTDIENLTTNGNADFRQNVNIDGTLTANILNLKSTNTTYANISTLYVSSLIGHSATLQSLSTNSISSGIIRTDEILAQSIYTNFLAGTNFTSIFLNADIDSQGFNISNVHNLTTSNISTSHISTLNLDMINGQGNILTLQSYNDTNPVLQLTRNIDGVEFAEGGLTANPDLGFTLASLSSLTVLAYDDINIVSGKNVIVAASTFNVPTSASIYGLSTHSISTNFVLADTVFAFKNLVAPSTLTQDIQLFSDIPNNIRSGITGDYLSYIDVGTGTFSTLYGISTLTSSITTHNMFVRGDVPLVGFFKPSDQENPIGAITAADGFGFGIVGTETVQILSTGGDIGITTPNNIALVADELVLVGGPELRVFSNANISSIQTNQVSTTSLIAGSATIINDLSANNLFTNSLYTIFLGNPLPYQAPITFNANLNISGNNISNAFLLQASNISTNFLSTGSLYSGVITTPALSTTTISTSVLNTNSINAPVNINCGKSLIPFSGNNLDLGNAGAFRWRNLWVSTISSLHVQTSTLATTQIAVDRIIGNASATNIFTNNLFPIGAGAQLGYNSSGTPGGGFYNILAVRSTFTQVINPSGEAGRFSNAVYINTNLSTQNVMVSSINNKVYPYTSTLNIPFSSFSITGNQAGTPILLYSNIDFRTQGFHRISQKAILSKNSGGASADIHANIFYSVGSFPSTPSITDGYSALPSVNQDNASTFTTLMTEFYVSTPTTRSIFYYDSTANNYTSRLYMGTLFDSVTPDLGINPTRVPQIF